MKAKTLGWLIVLMFLILGIMIMAIDTEAQKRPWREKPFIVTETERDALDEYFGRVYLDLRIADNDVCAYSDSNKSLVLDSVGTVMDTALAAFWLADSAQDSAGTAMDTSLAALDSVLGAGLPYVTAICDTTADTVQVQALRSCEDIYVNFDGPEGTAKIGFYDGASPIGQYIQWNNATSRFDISANAHLDDDLIVDGIVTVLEGQLNVGDEGGFSGLKFNSVDTELELWVDGASVNTADSVGTVMDTALAALADTVINHGYWTDSTWLMFPTAVGEYFIQSGQKGAMGNGTPVDTVWFQKHWTTNYFPLVFANAVGGAVDGSADTLGIITMTLEYMIIKKAYADTRPITWIAMGY